MTATTLDPQATAVSPMESLIERNESYLQLVWRRFRKSKPAIAGGLLVLILGVLALFADFFAPYPLDKIEMSNALIPPTPIHFWDEEGTFHWQPFVYNQVVTIDLKTFAPTWEEDTTQIYPIKFFARGWEYKFLGLIPMDRHLFTVDEGAFIFLLGTDKLGRDLWSKSCEAGRISLTMSIFGTIISVVIGSLVGVVSGYYGGITDNGIQRFVEFISAFPQLPLWMALAAIIPRTWSPFRIFIIMSFIFALLSWTVLAREVRGKV
ncbi:MAG: ABC transporter permease, partial [Caldilineaceae bacterium]